MTLAEPDIDILKKAFNPKMVEGALRILHPAPPSSSSSSASLKSEKQASQNEYYFDGGHQYHDCHHRQHHHQQQQQQKQYHVRRIRSDLTKRTIMEVSSDTQSNKWYRVSSEWCQCPMYCFNAQKNVESGVVHCCKHQLALRISLALGTFVDDVVTEHEFDKMLGYAMR